eukprot:scaffold34125_cov36-Tisochrysis_lutea.AAC.1
MYWARGQIHMYLAVFAVAGPSTVFPIQGVGAQPEARGLSAFPMGCGGGSLWSSGRMAIGG